MGTRLTRAFSPQSSSGGLTQGFALGCYNTRLQRVAAASNSPYKRLLHQETAGCMPAL